MWRRWGTPQNFYLTFIDEFEEQLFMYLCTKNLDDMIYNSWDIECYRLKLVVMGHLFPITAPTLVSVDNFLRNFCFSIY